MATRFRRLALVASVTVLAGCGTEHAAAPPRPTLPRDLAIHLATLSDATAQKLDRGDTCGARSAATDLQKQAADAIARGDVPIALRQPLRSTTDDLVRRIVCTQPTNPPAPPEEEHGKGKHKGHDRGEGD